MSQIHVIRHKVLVEGLSIRRTAREVGVSRNTVKKYLHQSSPQRIETTRARPVFDEVSGRMKELVEEWSTRTTTKQRITGTRLHRELVSEGFDVGASLVRKFLREQRHRNRDVMVPLVWTAGDAAQVDFFEVTVDVDGGRRKAWMFVMRLMYSGRDFVWVYDRCDQISFLDAHVRAFEHFGAVPQRCIYDNLTPAVSKIIGPKRELTGRFLALVSHYLYEPCFARPGVGHDKGGVESRGKAIRLRHLTPVPRGVNLVEISSALLGSIDEALSDTRHGRSETIASLYTEEMQKMLPLNGARFEARATKVSSVYANSTVRVLNSWYSVPSDWPRVNVTVLVGVDVVEIIQRHRRVTHPRVAAGKKSIKYRHYLPELSAKPQALRQVMPALLGELGDPFAELWRLLVDCHGPADASRVFAKMITAIIDHNESTVAKAVKAAMRSDDNNLNSLNKLYAPQKPSSVEIPEALTEYEIETSSAADFDALMRGGES